MKIINTTNNIYEDSESCIIGNHEESNFSNVDNEVRQTHSVRPLNFNIVVSTVKWKV